MADSIRTMIPALPARAGRRTRMVHSPFDGREIERVELADGDDLDAAVARSLALHTDRKAWLPVGDRVQILERAARALENDLEAIALLACKEGGKPLVDSRVEAVRAVDTLRLAAMAARQSAGSEVPMERNRASAGRIAFTHREPIGPVVALSAFNHPINNIAHQIAPAIAAGCPVVVKPAEATPLSALRLVALLVEAGLPPEWCQVVVVDDVALAERLACDARAGYVSFIGSAKVGWGLRQKIAPGVRIGLEHGGAAPVIVAADADVDDVMPILLRGGFYHAGQVCVSVQRIFVEAPLARSFAEELARRASLLRVGDPEAESTEVGPLIRAREVERVASWIRDSGAEVLCGAAKLSESTYAPTVLWDPPADARISQEELFGPGVCVYPYRELDEAIARANALPYAFQAAVCTRTLDTALAAWRGLAATAVMVNDATTFRVDWMPFSGARQSGVGDGSVAATMREMQVEKMLVVRSRAL